MWRHDDIVTAAAGALEKRAAELRDEQAPKGLDALNEVELHPILAAGFTGHGFGVVREQPFPGDAQERPGRTVRERCDLVLTPEPGMRLLEPGAEVKQLRAASGTLFEPVAESIAAAQTSGATDPGEAFWLEVKVVGQYTYTSGVPGPNGAYASELVAGPVEDLVKLEWDRCIRSGGLLLALFTEDRRTAEHDVGVLLHRCLDRELPVQSPLRSDFAIPDLIGNRVCSVVLIPIRNQA